MFMTALKDVGVWQEWTSAVWILGCILISSEWINQQVCKDACFLSCRGFSTAGAPPDAFDANGQNWGFPTYNWEEMEKDGYRWWKARLHQMAESKCITLRMDC